MSNIHAYTALGSEYPEFVSVNETDDPNLFSITVRSKPIVNEDGYFICGYPKDKGQLGRCTPGDDHCNNYCNLAPEKGRMQDHPKSCRTVREGTTAQIIMTMEQVERLAADILRATTGTAV